MKSTKQDSPAKRRASERRRLAALGAEQGKSNRLIADELGVDEGTVRRDLKQLDIARSHRPLITRWNRADLSRSPEPVKPSPIDRKPVPTRSRSRVRLNVVLPPKPVPRRQKQGLDRVHEQRIGSMVALVDAWLVEENLGRWSRDFVLLEAGRILEEGKRTVAKLPEPSVSPAQLWPRTRPERMDRADLDNVMKFEEDRALWLARWLAACLPGDPAMREEVLKRVQAPSLRR